MIRRRSFSRLASQRTARTIATRVRHSGCARRARPFWLPIAWVGMIAILLPSRAAVASQYEVFDLGSPRVEGSLTGEAYLVIDLPPELGGLAEGEVGEAILDVRTGWFSSVATLEAVPFQSGLDSIPVAGMARDGSRVGLVGRGLLTPRGDGVGRASISLRRLMLAIRDSTWEGDAVLLGLGGGSGPTRRWPASAISDYQTDPSRWSCRLTIFLDPAAETE